MMSRNFRTTTVTVDVDTHITFEVFRNCNTPSEWVVVVPGQMLGGSSLLLPEALHALPTGTGVVVVHRPGYANTSPGLAPHDWAYGVMYALESEGIDFRHMDCTVLFHSIASPWAVALGIKLCAKKLIGIGAVPPFSRAGRAATLSSSPSHKGKMLEAVESDSLAAYATVRLMSLLVRWFPGFATTKMLEDFHEVDRRAFTPYVQLHVLPEMRRINGGDGPYNDMDRWVFWNGSDICRLRSPCRVIIVRGEYDTALTPEMLEAWRAFAAVRTIELPNLGHFLAFDQTGIDLLIDLLSDKATAVAK